MDLCNKLLSKTPVSWVDLHKQLMSVMQSRGISGVSNPMAPSSNSTISHSNFSSLSINKVVIKQCTDLLIKHIKDLNQNQVVEQLEKFAHSTHLLQIYKTPSEEDSSTVNVFLSTDDFYFEVSISISGQISDVKFSIFSEPAKSSSLLKEIICSWKWENLSKHIDGIKSNYILNTSEQQIRAKAFKSLQFIEKDLSHLFQIETKYLQKEVQAKTLNNKNLIEKLINQSPIGLFKKSELGEPMRLYFYSSPLDLIKHLSHLKDGSQEDLCSSFKNCQLATSNINNYPIEKLIQFEIGCHFTISLHTSNSSDSTVDPIKYKLPCSSTLLLNENDEKNCHESLQPYFNTTDFLKFNSQKTYSLFSTNKSSDVELPGSFILNLSKPIVMCLSTLYELQTQIGVETINIDKYTETNKIANKLTLFFELLARIAINNKTLNDAYSVQLPDEIQVYYVTEQNQPECYGIVIERLHFTHPQQLVTIISCLRKQLLFNELLLSCMRKPCSGAYNYNKNKSQVRILEMCLLEPFRLSIIMQHPKLQCYTTIEIQIVNSITGAVTVQSIFRDHPKLLDSNIVNQILLKCHSIPVTIRALLSKISTQSDLENMSTNDSGGNNDERNEHKSPNRFQQSDLMRSNQVNSQSINKNTSNNNQNGQEDCLHLIPQSIYSCNDSNIKNPSTPNRQTPSRRDSYNPNNSINTAILANFNFSNYIYQSPTQSQGPANADIIISKLSFDRKYIDMNENKKDKKNDLLKTAKLNATLNKISKNDPSPQQSQLQQSSNKKRKAPSSRSTSPSLTVPQAVQPPNAKQRKTASQLNSENLKRHSSLIVDDSESSSSSSSSSSYKQTSNSKQKLKTSLSSVDLVNHKSNENKQKISIGQKISNSPSNEQSNKNSSKLNNSKNTPKIQSQDIKKQSSTPKPNSLNNKMSSKQITDDGLKLRISNKDQKDKLQRSTSASGGTKPLQPHNLSATEIQLKQPNNSPSLFSNSSNISTPSSTSSIIQQFSNQQAISNQFNRTPSPSLSAMSSGSWSASSITQMTTPSPSANESNDQTSQLDDQPKSEPSSSSTKNQKLKNIKQASDLFSTKTKSNSTTPSSVSALAMLGLSMSKPSNFKIPHKTKTAVTESSNESSASSNDNEPLSSSSPIITKIGNSPIKSQSSAFTANKNNKSMPPPITTPSSQIQRNNNNNLSPKWQATYSTGTATTANSTNSGNISPRYNNFDTNSNSGTNNSTLLKNPNNQKFKTQQQRMSSPTQNQSTNRPLTPTPNQFPASNTSNATRNTTPATTNSYFNNSKTPYNVHQSTTSTTPMFTSASNSNVKQILPLMSFNQTTPTAISQGKSIKDIIMTPKSPSPTPQLNVPILSSSGNSMTSNPNMSSSIPVIMPITGIIEIPTEPTINKQNSKPANTIVDSGPPDSPTCETTTIFIPKLIPLERNITNQASGDSLTKEIPSEKPILQNQQKSRPIIDEIASPDAAPADEDDDNLVIDLITNATNNSSHNMNTNINTVIIPNCDNSINKPSSPVEQINPNSKANEIASIPVVSTFATRQLSNNSQNEILSPASNSSNSQVKSPLTNTNVCSSKSTKSPCIIEEDLLNDAVTG